MGFDVQARVFVSVPIDKKQLDNFILSENQRVDSCAMCQEMIRSRYYVEAMKRLSKAFPEIEFTTVYFTDLSMSALFIEKFTAGEITQSERRYKKLSESMKTATNTYAKEHELHEITKMLPSKRKKMIKIRPGLL